MTTTPSARTGLIGRLLITAAALALTLIGAAVHTSRQLSILEDAAHSAEASRFPQLQRMAQVQLEVTRLSLQLRHAMLSRTPQERDATLQDIRRLKSAIAELVGAYEHALHTDAGRQQFLPVQQASRAFTDIELKNLALIEAGQTAEAFAFLVDQTIPARNALLQEIAANVKYQESRLQDELQLIKARANSARLEFGLVAVAVVLALLATTGYLARALRRRVQALTEVAHRLRDGDFTQPVQDTQSDEFSTVMRSMQHMQEALAEVVRSVRANAQCVATGSAQIATGTTDLSQRTEEQASALQQTAATMDQLGATVRNNAAGAQQANQRALQASEVARRGGGVVAQAVETMKGINESSHRIADITGVIDSIAFQTNILALNAAVEAARAGEQGRGFAVVAGEVRVLAQRSAEAAREIKALIGNSVACVEQGAQLVDLAGATMGEVEAAIHRVTDLMGEISAASQEQSTGIGQVGEAVSAMDQVTQQNAALVEESAAASESLRSQSAQLLHVVAFFRLPDDPALASSDPVASRAASARGALAQPGSRARSQARTARHPSRTAGVPVALKSVATHPGATALA